MVRADAEHALGPRRPVAADARRQRILVEAIAQGTVQPWAMTFWQKRDLIMNDDAAIRASARALLEESTGARAVSSIAMRPRSSAAATPLADEEVFARTCAACHHLGGGTVADVGPDLATIRHRPPLSLLVDIFRRAIDRSGI